MKRCIEASSDFNQVNLTEDTLPDYLYEIIDSLEEARDELDVISVRTSVGDYDTKDLCYDAKSLKENINDYINMCYDYVEEL